MYIFSTLLKAEKDKKDPNLDSKIRGMLGHADAIEVAKRQGLKPVEMEMKGIDITVKSGETLPSIQADTIFLDSIDPTVMVIQEAKFSSTDIKKEQMETRLILEVQSSLRPNQTQKILILAGKKNY